MQPEAANEATVATDQKADGGASSVEVYGFVGWITSAVTYGAPIPLTAQLEMRSCWWGCQIV